MSRTGGRSTLAGLTILALTVAACGGSRTQLRKADAYLAEDRPGAAIRAYEKVLERKPGHPEALVGIARAWIADDEPERALVPAQVAVEVEQDGAREALSRALILTGRGGDAVPHLTAAIDASKGVDPTLQSLLAEARLAARDVPGATGAAEGASEAGGGAGAQALAAWLHARADNCDRATMLAGRAVTAAMAEAEVQAEAAAVFRHCGDAQRAQGAASTARTLQANGPDPWQAEAARLSQGGDNEGAARRLSWLRATWPEDGLLARDLGAVWASLGADALAERELRQALELAPFAVAQGSGSVRVVNRRADALDNEAREAALRDIHTRLFKVRTQMGDLRGAARSMQAVAELGVSDANLWLQAAQAWARAGSPKSGVTSAAEAVKLAPRDPRTQAVAASLYRQVGDVARAIGHGRIAWELEPGQPDVALDLAALYEGRGEMREARRILAVTAERVPGDPRLKAAIAKLDKRGGF